MDYTWSSKIGFVLVAAGLAIGFRRAIGSFLIRQAPNGGVVFFPVVFDICRLGRPARPAC